MKTQQDKMYGQWVGGAALAGLCLPMLVPPEYVTAGTCVLTLLLAPAIAGILTMLCVIGATLFPTYGRLFWNLGELFGQFAVSVERVLAIVPRNPFALGLANHLYFLSIVLASKCDYAGSIETAGEVLKLLEKSEGTEAVALVEPLSLMCSNYRGIGNFVESSKCADRLLAVARNHQKEYAATIGATLADLCVTYAKQGRVEESFEIGEKAVRLLQEMPETDPLSKDVGIIAIALNNLGYVYSQACKYDRAYTFYERAMQMKLKSMPPNSPSIGASYANMACAMNMKGHYEEAAEYAGKAAAIFDTAGNKQNYADAQQAMGNAKRGLGKYVDSEKSLLEALAIQQKHLGEGDPALAETFLDLAKLYNDTGETEKSRDYFQKALVLFEKAVGIKHPQVARTLIEYASFLRSHGQDKDADAAEIRSREILDEPASAA